VNIQQVRQAMANTMDQETLEKLAEEISKRVTENVIEYLDEEKKSTVEEKDCCKWITDENTMVCEPCLMFAKCPERPPKYAKYYRSNFGTFDIR
jgi:hypothetical protein